mgnify:CR=1 FL=1
MAGEGSKLYLVYFYFAFTSLLWSYIVILFFFCATESNATDGLFVERLSWSGAHGRVLIVSDISGCIKELQHLIKSSSYRPEKDSLIFIGDMVGEGPASAQVVQFAMDHDAECIRGPVEDKIVSWYLTEDENTLTNAHEREIAKNLKDDQLQYLLACSLDVELQEHNTRIIHSGLNPQGDLHNQREELLLKLGQESGKITNRVTSWFDDWNGPELIVFGGGQHTNVQQKHSNNQLTALGLATGVAQGQTLSALALPDTQILQVPSKANYSGQKHPEELMGE